MDSTAKPPWLVDGIEICRFVAELTLCQLNLFLLLTFPTTTTTTTTTITTTTTTTTTKSYIIKALLVSHLIYGSSQLPFHLKLQLSNFLFCPCENTPK